MPEFIPISHHTARRWDKEVLLKTLSAPDLDNIQALLIDEKSIGKVHHYLTAALNASTSEILFLGEGKVNTEKDLHRFDDIGELDTGESIYTGVVHSRCLKCPIRVVMLRIQRNTKIGMSLLYSTDTELEAMTIIRYYKARCQIEFIFRGGKTIHWSYGLLIMPKGIHTHPD